MPIFNFDAEFKLGIPKIDEEHARLVNMLNEMQDLVKLNEKDKACVIFRETMSAFVSSHFDHEEAFMREIGYPRVDEHAQLHRNFKRSMEAVMEKINSMDEAAFRNAMTDTYTWIITHIGKTDRKYASYLKEQEPV